MNGKVKFSHGGKIINTSPNVALYVKRAGKRSFHKRRTPFMVYAGDEMAFRAAPKLNNEAIRMMSQIIPCTKISCPLCLQNELFEGDLLGKLIDFLCGTCGGHSKIYFPTKEEQRIFAEQMAEGRARDAAHAEDSFCHGDVILRRANPASRQPD